MLVSDISLGEVVLDKCGVRMIPQLQEGGLSKCAIYGCLVTVCCCHVSRYNVSMNLYQ